jgi:hypothetical protein
LTHFLVFGHAQCIAIASLADAKKPFCECSLFYAPGGIFRHLASYLTGDPFSAKLSGKKPPSIKAIHTNDYAYTNCWYQDCKSSTNTVVCHHKKCTQKTTTDIAEVASQCEPKSEEILHAPSFCQHA